MKISQCLGVNLRTVQRIQKELDESNGDYKDMAAWKLHFDHSDEKITPEFVGEIQAIIDNDPSKSIRSIVMNIVVFEVWFGLMAYQPL